MRVSSNARLLSCAKTPAEALSLLKRIVALPGHEFWPDETNLAVTPFLVAERIVSHGQVTDAHLLALALQRMGRLVTFDSGVKALLPPGSAPEGLVVLGSPREPHGKR